jgi:hypothetical protein
MIIDWEPTPAPEVGETSFVRLADAHRREGLVEDAIRICREGLARVPSSLRGRIVLGQSLLDQGAIGEAIVELARVEREGHGDSEILALLCEVCWAGPQAWPVGADLVRGAAGLAATPVEDQEAVPNEQAEPPVLILDASGQPTVDGAVLLSSSDDPLATPTLAGLYARQGDPDKADAILRRITPDEAPPTPEMAPPTEPGPVPYLHELTRLRRIAERLRRAHAPSADRGA